MSVTAASQFGSSFFSYRATSFLHPPAQALQHTLLLFIDIRTGEHELSLLILRCGKVSVSNISKCPPAYPMIKNAAFPNIAKNFLRKTYVFPDALLRISSYQTPTISSVSNSINSSRNQGRYGPASALSYCVSNFRGVACRPALGEQDDLCSRCLNAAKLQDIWVTSAGQRDMGL